MSTRRYCNYDSTIIHNVFSNVCLTYFKIPFMETYEYDEEYCASKVILKSFVNPTDTLLAYI